MTDLPHAPGKSGKDRENYDWTYLAVFAVILIANLLLRCWFALQPTEIVDDKFLSDDTYYCLSIAKSLSEGLGPWYEIGYTNGFQPLYVLLIAPLFWLFPNDLIAPIHGALLVSSLMDTIALALLIRLACAVSRSRLTPLVIGALWMLTPRYIMHTLNGMETMTSICLLMAVVERYLAIQGRADSARSAHLGLGALMGLAVMARVDNVFLFPSLGGVILFRNLKFGWNSILKKLILIALGAAITYSPWAMYSFFYTGLVYPVSGKAVRYLALARINQQPNLDWYLLQMSEAWSVLRRQFGGGVIATLLLLAAAWFMRKPNDKFGLSDLPAGIPVQISIVFGALLYAGYVFYVPGYWFYSRYLAPMMVPVIFLQLLSLDRVLTLIRLRRQRLIVAIVSCVGMLGLQVRFEDVKLLVWGGDTNIFGYMDAGLWARNNFSDGTTLGCGQSGAVAYFAENLKVVNLDGVMNRDSYDSLVEGRAMDYVREMGIEYLFGSQLSMEYTRDHQENYDPTELSFEKSAPGISSLGAGWLVHKVNYNSHSAR